MKKSSFIALVCLLVAIIAGFFGGYKVAQRGFPDIEEKSDTIFLWDTVKIEKPVAKDSIVYKYIAQYFPVHDTTLIHDSVLVDVPIERKVYQEDSTYYAVVSGWHPSLDTLKVYKETVMIETTKTVTKYQPYKWTLGPFISQEVGLGDYYVAKAGIAGDFQLKGRFRFQPEVGYYATSLDNRNWYAGAKFKFELIRKK